MRTLLVGLALSVSLVLTLSACVSTVDGRAVRAAGTAPADVPPLTEAQLDGVLLSIGELNGIVGSTQMTVTSELDEMTDHSADLSDPKCVGAIYGAEEPVYAGSGWTAVRDQVAREPSEDNDHWVEQTAVLYPSADQAQAFVDSSRTTWEECQASDITVDDGADSYVWQMDPVQFDGQLLTQVSEQRDADGWACQHALTAVSNVTVETWACGYTISDEAATIATEMVANATER
ncbi:sensor domain-containing protein [Mycolicibacterium sp. S2-37]|uniref:sensor domain-containing protein n=1 Tax=Mycolicibacterium sp. S2-37 TaxID=2810297 RepID=UPI001A94AAF3|nr:sensor domain-containing protein [Mycolicibacterium sp. S2-37]MBO0678216.1 sensor domain-containing protein [Mycolicibacterium sp. S2-37]